MNFDKEMQDFYKMSISTKLKASQTSCQKEAQGYISKELLKVDIVWNISIGYGREKQKKECLSLNWQKNGLFQLCLCKNK